MSYHYLRVSDLKHPLLEFHFSAGIWGHVDGQRCVVIDYAYSDPIARADLARIIREEAQRD